MKKLTVIILSALLILMMTTTAFADPSNWAVQEVEEARSKNLVVAEANQNFQDYITRELFCKLIVRVIEQQKGGPVEVTITNPFNDTTNEQIVKAYQLGIVKGVSATQFAPQNLITRQEVAVMMMRAFRVLDGMKMTSLTQNVDVSGISFNDQANIASWALQDVMEAVKLMLVKGVGGNKMNPLGNTTVEQSILLSLRLYNNYQPNAAITPPSAPPTTAGQETTTESTNKPPQAKAANLEFDAFFGDGTNLKPTDFAVDPDGDAMRIISFELPINTSSIFHVIIMDNGELSVTPFSDPSLEGQTTKYIVTVTDDINEPVKIEITFKAANPPNAQIDPSASQATKPPLFSKPGFSGNLTETDTDTPLLQAIDKNFLFEFKNYDKLIIKPKDIAIEAVNARNMQFSAMGELADPPPGKGKIEGSILLYVYPDETETTEMVFKYVPPASGNVHDLTEEFQVILKDYNDEDYKVKVKIIVHSIK